MPSIAAGGAAGPIPSRQRTEAVPLRHLSAQSAHDAAVRGIASHAVCCRPDWIAPSLVGSAVFPVCRRVLSANAGSTHW